MSSLSGPRSRSSRSEGGPEPEVIDFFCPLGNERNVYITNIITCSAVDTDLIESSLHQTCSKFGLIYEVQAFSSPSQRVNMGQSTPHDGKAGECAIQASHKPAGMESAVSSALCTTSAQTMRTVPSDDTTSLSLCYCPNALSHQTKSSYAFVKFYSSMAARHAKNFLHLTHVVGTKACKVRLAQRRKALKNEKRELYASQCQDVANFYLGFNGWSSEIKLLQREDPDPAPAAGEWACQFVCVLDIHISSRNLVATGVGISRETCSTQEPVSKIRTTGLCRKRASQRALQNAFSKIILVVLGNGKVYPEVDTTALDNGRILDKLQEPNLLKVTELEREPEEEMGSDMDEGDDGDLDDVNVNILLQLEDECA